MRWSYTSNNQSGTDTIEACTVDPATGQPQCAQVTNTWAVPRTVDAFFSLDDPAQDANIIVVGSAAFVDTGGVTNSRYLKLTDDVGQSCAVLFPDFEPGSIVASFTFECMIKLGDWYSSAPADGFSVNFARANDPIIPLIASGTNPGRSGGRTDAWHSSLDQGGDEYNLPEEGTQTGVAVGFDTWGAGNSPGGIGAQNGLLDARGISVRVDGTFANFCTTFKGVCYPGQVIMPNVVFPDGDAHDYEHDATTLITGPFSNGGGLWESGQRRRYYGSPGARQETCLGPVESHDGPQRVIECLLEKRPDRHQCSDRLPSWPGAHYFWRQHGRSDGVCRHR